jgi:hypothetical protein
MITSMRARPKGDDLLSRVPEWNRFVIPEIAPGDQIAIIASQLGIATQNRGVSINAIEKSALYYILMQADYRSARRLSDFIGSAMLRIGATKDQLDFDDLFNQGDLRGKRFWAAHQNATEALSNTYVRLKWTSGNS